MAVSRSSISADLDDRTDPSGQPRNLAAMLLRAAHRHPSRGIQLISAEQEKELTLVTYSALLSEARRVLGGLLCCGGSPGTNVVLLLDGPGDVIPAFWACALGGLIPCPMTPIRNDPQRWAKHLSHVNTLLDHPLLVTTRALQEELPNDLKSVDIDTLRTGKPSDSVSDAQPRDPAALMLTSGSTGHSKAVVLTHANLLASLAGRSERQQMTYDDVTLNWIAFDHVAALLESHMVALYVGATQLHAQPAAILADPLRFLRLIHRYRVTIAFAPNFLLGQINSALRSVRTQPLDLDLKCLRRIVTGGEANLVETGRRFLELLAPHGLARNVLWPAFGMTETCAASVYSDEFPDRDADREFASVGRPINGLEIRVVGEDGKVLPGGQAGELQLRGPLIFGRYYNNVEATQAAFTPDGWFRTGDLGYIEGDRLSLVGRSKDCIIVNGVNYFSHELEMALEPLDGIERSFIAAFPTRPKGADTEQLVIAFATTFALEDEAELHRLIIAVRNTAILLWGFRPALIVPLPKSAFPKTSLGKTQRSLMRKRLEAEELATELNYVKEMTQRQLGGYTAPQGPVESAITQIYAEIFEIDPATLSATANFFDLGGTSLDIIKLTRKLAASFGIPDIPVTTILKKPTVKALGANIATPAGDVARGAYDPIVPLQLTGRKTPLFCIHPAVGEVLVYVNLAKYFVNDRPFYALRARGFDAGEDYFGTLKEVVQTYVEAIRRHQPHGPYYIAGYSFGGIAGFEVAKALEAQGERVAFFCSIDMPPYVTEPITPDYCAISLAYFLSLIDKDKMLEMIGKYRGEDPDLCEQLVKHAPQARLAELNLDLAKFRPWAALTYSLGKIAKSYEPQGNIERVSVLFTRPEAGHDWLQGWVDVQIKRWDAHSRLPVRYVEVAGEHASLMDSQHVAGFQTLLRSELDRAQS